MGQGDKLGPVDAVDGGRKHQWSTLRAGGVVCEHNRAAVHKIGHADLQYRDPVLLSTE